ncbi:PREDICTED: inhibitor of nuclear factor kappa-B kinase subunit epsilon [Trachymyrmex cornetzi]|uniref:Serine/threonine-protein kinase TBK1 n=1 Tax=Trachymyrmex cornetzi TaxID=471704 RepID=A0A195EGY5_9HYME|nr:PREDICTED: inhibitor of nuclear factor kappa-B kinase subunit epsilon [Trachymyrmex cornetzi]KYN27147.1 Serine/threonine-protein kinase TBK1 [Trachymyrmex cornetzi]
MSFLRGSANYVWCTTSVLGKGATGAVFQGVNKNNGEPVAVKTFNQLSHMRPHDVQVREFEVLKKVKHENIVKLLAIEEEQDGRGKVIVMELCTGGSLFNILDDPENTYGLAESEFLLVLEHLSAGMKHLRDNNLVHRDLKPGNIMKFIADDGSTIYKLTDFGAARELQEDQQFVSLYGTEEYLHPDMYERAVLRKPVGKTFGATVDLWSIGVTLYHVATGNLPFRPFGGRRNKETMFYITTKKASGVISGLQTSENGPIEWSRELPQACQLSTGLKKIVTPLLAGLLEVDPQRIWSFERFFSEVTDTLCRKPIHIFNIHKASLIKVFLHPEEKLVALQIHIQDQTEIMPHAQILLLGEIPLTNLVEESTPGKGYPNTNNDKPLMLFSRENNNVVLPTETELPKFPVFANLVSVENDASQAKVACSVGHVCKRRIDKLALCSKLSRDAIDAFSGLLSTELTRVLEKCQHSKEFTKAVEDTVLAVERSETFARHVFRKFGSQTAVEVKSWRKELDVKSKELMSELTPAIVQLHQRYVKEGNLHGEWDNSTRGLWCPWTTKASQRAATLVDRLRDGWQHLLRDRATRSLTYNDEQFHVLERIKVTETGRRLKALLETECIPAMTQRSECVADWYKMAQTVFLQTQILDKDIDSYERVLESFSYHLSQESKERNENLLHSLDRLPGKSKTIEKTSVPVQESTKKWRNICDTQEQITMLLYENGLLVDQLDHLSVIDRLDDIGDTGYEL